MLQSLARPSISRARGFALSLLALGALGLAACEKPEPQIPEPTPDGPPPAPAPGPSDDPPVAPVSSDDVHPVRRESSNLVSDRTLGFETGGATLTAEGAGAVRDLAA